MEKTNVIFVTTPHGGAAGILAPIFLLKIFPILFLKNPYICWPQIYVGP
jgi:hypothetical protein